MIPGIGIPVRVLPLIMGGTMFLPYLSGERTPHNDATVRGVFAGLDHAADRNALTRAVLEGVAFALRDNLEALRDAGTEVDGLIAVGGGSRATYWLAAIANALELPISVPEEGDFGAAFGAARLGLIAASGADPLTICSPPRIAETIEPTAELIDAFERGHRRYRSLYPAISSASG